MAYPVIAFDGGDGTGKTTQSLLLGEFLFNVFQGRVVYFSFPVYEFPLGRVIGNFLGRWGKRIEPTPLPEDAALLYSLNRLEALPYLIKALDEDYIVICNRGPYANIFNVARKVLEDGIDWGQLSPKEKGQRVTEILIYDAIFLAEILSRRELINIFLNLDPEEAMELASQKALSTLGGEPDLHEGWWGLQQLAARIYEEVAEGKIKGHQAEMVEATSGRLRIYAETRDLGVFDAILETSKRVMPKVAESFGWDPHTVQAAFLLDAPLYIPWVARSGAYEGVGFEFRKVFELEPEFQPNLWETRPELMKVIGETRPGAIRAIEASRELDRKQGLGPEKRF